MKKIVFALPILLFSPLVTKADSLADVTLQISSGSVLKLRDDVAQDFAENLLAAQAAAYYTQFEPDSLQLSIDAVLRAIRLEKSFHTKYCDDNNCQIVWSQSNIAIDDRAHVILSASVLQEPVSTPEPTTWFLLAIASILGFSKLLRMRIRKIKC